MTNNSAQLIRLVPIFFDGKIGQMRLTQKVYDSIIEADRRWRHKSRGFRKHIRRQKQRTRK